MSINVKPVFNRTGNKNKSGLYKVNIRVTIDRKQYYLQIQHFPKINPKHWDNVGRRIKNSYHLHSELNRILFDAVQDIDKFIYSRVALRKPVTIELIREHFYFQGWDECLNVFARDYVLKNAKTLGTLKKYRTLISVWS